MIRSELVLALAKENPDLKAEEVEKVVDVFFDEIANRLADGGRVINLSSATIFSGSEQWAHYVASKGGVVALTRVMAKELGRRGITVNAIAPGFTLTEASYGLMENAENYGVDRGAIKRASQPEDIVGAALFLAGPDSSYYTGQTMVVDGGRQFI